MTEKLDEEVGKPGKTRESILHLAERLRKTAEMILKKHTQSKTFNPVRLEEFLYTPPKHGNELKPTTCVYTDTGSGLYDAFSSCEWSHASMTEWFRFDFEPPVATFGEGRRLQTLVAYYARNGSIEIFLANHDFPVVDPYNGTLSMRNIMANFHYIAKNVAMLLHMENEGKLPEWKSKTSVGGVVDLNHHLLKETLTTLYLGDGNWDDKDEAENLRWPSLGKAKEQVHTLLQYYACLSWFFHEGGGREDAVAEEPVDEADRYKARVTLLLASKLQVSPEEAEYILKTCPPTVLKSILLK